MRAKSSAPNFTLDDLTNIVTICRERGVKSYLTVNVVIYDNEMETMRMIIDRAKSDGIDAIIATDMAAILYARKVGVEVHISTQSNISNADSVEYFAQWADVVVLARELSLEQIAYIHQQIVERDIRGPRGELVEIEMFAHGALCMSISGKCYLSLHENDCSANRGACRQICRRKYTVQMLKLANSSIWMGSISYHLRIYARSISSISLLMQVLGCKDRGSRTRGRVCKESCGVL